MKTNNSKKIKFIIPFLLIPVAVIAGSIAVYTQMPEDIKMMIFISNPVIKGNGKIVVEDRKIEAKFNKIEISNGLNLSIEQSNKGEVLVETDENLQSKIIVVVERDVLKIYSKETLKSETLNISVKMPEIKSIEASSASTVKSINRLKSSSLNIESSSSASINLEVDVKELDCNSSSASKVVLSGSSKEIEINASSAAKIEAIDLKAREVEVNASSGSDVSVNALSSLDAHASSGAKIFYKGEPDKLEVKSSSGGKVLQK